MSENTTTHEFSGSRRKFLDQVRHALGHSSQGDPPPPSQPPVRTERLIRQVSSSDPRRVDRWIALAKKNGMKVQRASAVGLASAVDTFLTGTEVKSIMLNFSDLPENSLRSHLVAKGYAVRLWGEENCSRNVFESDAALTDCRYGLADTGSLLVWSDSGFGRSTTLTVPLHIVLLPAARIVADMIDALPRVRRDTAGLMPSNVVIINGPSKTADIEMNLVTGVHGPKFLYVIVIDD